MRVAIVGSRQYPDLARVTQYVEALPRDTVVVTGAWPGRYGGYDCVEATVGVDRTAYLAAEKTGKTTCLVSGSKTVDGKKAGLIRNPTIIDLAESVVAFWDGSSRGTIRGVGYAAERRDRGIMVIGPDGAVIQPAVWWAFYVNLKRNEQVSWGGYGP